MSSLCARGDTQALLASPPSMVRGTGYGGEETMVLLSPLTIVENICETRQVIAERWVSEMRLVAEEHTDLQRQLLQDSL